MNDWLENFPDHLPTPFIAVDQQIFLRNFQAVLAYAQKHSFTCCPHIKAHKCLTLAQLQIDAGCEHFCVAKADEGLVLSELSIKSVLCTCPPVGKARIQRLIALAGKVSVRVAVDCPQQVVWLAEAAESGNVSFEVMLDIDLGLGRTGIRHPDGVDQVLLEVARHKRLSFAGVQLYPGNIWGEKVQDTETWNQINAQWEPCFQKIRKSGRGDCTVSVGASPILFESHRIAHTTEIRPGGLLMGDYWLLSEQACSLAQCAMRVITSIISSPEQGRALIDAGSKALCGRSIWGQPDRGFARIDQYPGATVFKIHEEIGWINYVPGTGSFAVGERLSLLPVLVGPTISQYRSLFLKRENQVKEVAIEASGALC